jgi:hypothetical protein
MVFNADVVRTSGSRDRQSESDGCTCTCSVPPDITAIYPKLREQNVDVLMGAFRSLGEHIVRLRTLLDLPLGARARVYRCTNRPAKDSSLIICSSENRVAAYIRYYCKSVPYCSGTYSTVCGVSIEAGTK